MSAVLFDLSSFVIFALYGRGGCVVKAMGMGLLRSLSLEDSVGKSLVKSVRASPMEDLVPNYWLAVQTPFFSQH